MVLPELNAERCVHAILPKASCRACVDACPRYAWILGDTALKFNEFACDGCGLCAPVCPSQAIRFPLGYAQRALVEETVLLAHCDFSGEENDSGRVPCLHDIGLHELLRAWRKGQRAWLVRRGNCENCTRGQCVRLDKRVSVLNSGLASRGLPQVILREVPATAWNKLLGHSPVDSKASRRRFFAALGKRPVSTLMKNGLDSVEHEPLAPGEYLPDQPGAIQPWHVRINPSRCTACHACVHVCPRNAIQHVQSGSPAYKPHHRLCTGCGLCQDVCDQNAISLHEWEMADSDEVVLKEQRCDACGMCFQTPAERGKVSTCWICSRASPKRQLRKVLA